MCRSLCVCGSWGGGGGGGGMHMFDSCKSCLLSGSSFRPSKSTSSPYGWKPTKQSLKTSTYSSTWSPCSPLKHQVLCVRELRSGLGHHLVLRVWWWPGDIYSIQPRVSAWYGCQKALVVNSECFKPLGGEAAPVDRLTGVVCTSPTFQVNLNLINIWTSWSGNSAWQVGKWTHTFPCCIILNIEWVHTFHPNLSKVIMSWQSASTCVKCGCGRLNSLTDILRMEQPPHKASQAESCWSGKLAKAALKGLKF